MRVSFQAILLSNAISLFAGFISPAFGQNIAGDDRAGSDIVVTARRMEERLQDVPISITVFNQQQISDRNMVNAQDLANYTPSLSANGNFGSENSTFAIRGFNQDIGTPASVGVSVSANYTLPVDTSIGEISFGATLSYSSRQLSNYAYADPAVIAAYGENFGYLASRKLLNLNASWKSIGGSPVDLSLFATNVTREKYYTFIPGLAGAGFESAILGEPRMYGVRIRYRFERK